MRQLAGWLFVVVVFGARFWVHYFGWDYRKKRRKSDE